MFQDSLDAFLALAEILKLKGLSGGAEAEEKSVKETPRPQGRIDQSTKQEIDAMQVAVLEQMKPKQMK